LLAVNIYSCNKGAILTQGSNYGNMGTGAMTTITIQNMQFMPDSLTVKTGTTVTWANMDNMTYSVVELSGQFNSGGIMPGQMFAYTFMNPGTFTYRSDMTMTMKNGVVVVTN
jgi:plastocyanin